MYESYMDNEKLLQQGNEHNQGPPGNTNTLGHVTTLTFFGARHPHPQGAQPERQSTNQRPHTTLR